MNDNDLSQLKFCTTWASSQYETEPFNMPSFPMKGTSIRQIVKSSIGGKKIRFKFSNLCGETELEIKSVHFAVSKGLNRIDVNSDVKITFDKNETVVIPAHEEVYSDLIDYDLKSRTEYAFTIYYGIVPEKVTGHPGSRTTSYQEKDCGVSKEYFSTENTFEHWYTIAAIEVVNDAESKAVVCFGDSITDGRGSINNLQNRWTDILANRLNQNEKTKKLAVINQGIGGTCITSSGVYRFNHDVLQQPSIAYLIILYGINDIIYANCNADQIVAVYKDFIRKARENGIKVYGGTILPFGKCGDWNSDREKIRVEVNDWIKNNAGKSEGFDAFIDFAAAIKNGDLEELPEANENDGLHPTAKGYEIMGNCIDLSLFE